MTPRRIPETLQRKDLSYMPPRVRKRSGTCPGDGGHSFASRCSQEFPRGREGVVLLSAESRRRRERKRLRSQEEEEGQGQGTRAGDAEAKQVVVARIEPRSGVQEAEDKAEERKRRQRLQQQQQSFGRSRIQGAGFGRGAPLPRGEPGQICGQAMSRAASQDGAPAVQEDPVSLASREPGPAMVQYFRQTLSRLNPSRPLAREALSLCAVMDQLFEGEVVRALDVSMQRLKYLEAIMRGRRPEVASRMELIPEILNSVATDEELRTAAKEQKQDERLQASAGRRPWTGGSGSASGVHQDQGDQALWQGKGGDHANRSYPPKGRGWWSKGGKPKGKEKGSKGAPQSEVVKPKPADA